MKNQVRTAALLAMYVLLGVPTLSPGATAPALSPASTAPALKLTLKSDKAQYIQREPIRLLASIEYGAEDQFTITYTRQESSPARFDFHQVLPDGTTKILGTFSPRPALGDRVGGRAPVANVTWSAKKDSALHFWNENPFDPGVIKCRATFTPLAGPLKGNVYTSNDVEITVRPPQGKDKAAYDFLLAPGVAHQNMKRPSFLYECFPNLQLEYDYFIKNYGDSTYAAYVRHLMTRYLSSGGGDSSPDQKMLEELVTAAPTDFPLLADVYVHLLEHHKRTGHLQQMFDTAQKARKDHVVSADPAVDKWLNALIDEINSSWPPKTPADKEKALKAELLVAVQEAAAKHPITAALTAAYGPGRQPGSQNLVPVGSNALAHTGPTWGMWFYDPRQDWFLMAKFVLKDDGSLQQAELSGALESFCVGPLKTPLEEVKKEQGLQKDAALKAFVQMTIYGGTIDGRVEVSPGRIVTFTKTLAK